MPGLHEKPVDKTIGEMIVDAKAGEADADEREKSAKPAGGEGGQIVLEVPRRRRDEQEL